MAQQQSEPAAAAKPHSPLTIARQWWPVLIPPLVVVAVYAARSAGLEELIGKRTHEMIALCLLSAALAVAVKGCLVQRDRFYVVLAALCLVFLLREIHFPGAKEVLYGSVGVIGIWSVLWRKHLLGGLVGKARGRWLVMTVWAYLLALLIQRRALKFLPDEDHIHTQLEEVLENLAHLFLLILNLL